MLQGHKKRFQGLQEQLNSKSFTRLYGYAKKVEKDTGLCCNFLSLLMMHVIIVLFRMWITSAAKLVMTVQYLTASLAPTLSCLWLHHGMFYFIFICYLFIYFICVIHKNICFKKIIYVLCMPVGIINFRFPNIAFTGIVTIQWDFCMNKESCNRRYVLLYTRVSMLSLRQP